LSLVRGMLKVEVGERFTMLDVRKHPWFTRHNPHLDAKGKAANPIGLATQMMESLHIDFAKDVTASQRRPKEVDPDAMDVDSQPGWTKFASTQPETPSSELNFDWEAPPRLGAGISASQPMVNDTLSSPMNGMTMIDHSMLLSQLSEDPSMSQFKPTPSVPLTRTQFARRFADIVPSHSLARFLSVLSFAQVLPMLVSALHRLNIPIAEPSQAALEGRERTVSLRIKAVDANQQPLQGSLVIETLGMQTPNGGQVLEVRFIKAKGDPLGWRRLFKQVAVLCKDGIVVPHQ
jgi:serine/threonine-protein kinase CHEK1